MPRGSAPGERRGGRQKGTPNRATASVRAILEDAGANPAERLIALAQRAEKTGEIALAADIWSKLAAFAYPKPRPAELDPDRVIELEKAIIEAKLEAAANAAERNPGLFGLGDRLSRALARIDGPIEAETVLRTQSQGDDEKGGHNVATLCDDQDDDEPEETPPPRQSAPPPAPPEPLPSYRPLLPPRPQLAEVFDPHDL